MTLESTTDDSNHDLPTEECSHPYDAHLARTFLFISGRQLSEQEIARQSVLKRQSDHPLLYPVV